MEIQEEDRDELDLERASSKPPRAKRRLRQVAGRGDPRIQRTCSGASRPRVPPLRPSAFALRRLSGSRFSASLPQALGGATAIAMDGGKDSDDKAEHQNDGISKDDDDDDDADEDQYDKKVVICHHPNGNDPHTIRVSKKAAAKHIANHGDTLGRAQ